MEAAHLPTPFYLTIVVIAHGLQHSNFSTQPVFKTVDSLFDHYFDFNDVPTRSRVGSASPS